MEGFFAQDENGMLTAFFHSLVSPFSPYIHPERCIMNEKVAYYGEWLVQGCYGVSHRHFS